MKIHCFSVLMLLSASFFSCDDKSVDDLVNNPPIINEPDDQPPTPEPPTPQLPNLGPPVETASPNTNYSPAFEGQTRVGSITTTTPYEVEVISTNLQSPWGITYLPDGRLLVTEKQGRLKIFSTSGVLEKTITGIPNVVNSGQGGLLDVAVDPNFSSNRMIYWTQAHSHASGNLTAVAKGRLSDDETTIENPVTIFQATPAYSGSLHFGSRIVFDDEQNLFVSTGERSSAEMRMNAQDKSTGLGKVFRINRNGEAVASNPFVNDNSAMPQVYSYGHRNPQGLAIHPVTKELWQTEMGARGGDEINRIQSGKNYGWPIITYGLEYSGAPIGSGITQQTGMEQPVYYWDPSVSPSGIDFYTGNGFEEWKNNLFIGALSGQHIVRIYLHENKVYGEERLLENVSERFRDILASHPDGSIYAITDSGKIYRIFSL
ncbi:MAG TPA: PQQ-dependent sugar dehydrogenase [Flavobacterium sp.]|nr:PQQ-dependent sugar dehydrogenase [Flavobacterium sp.]